ncbi:deoxyribonuclease IV [Brevibacillus sp. SYP-B805]|uniref:deoxyribonuclease IV n=1 Tax=Brevibacillus sp. SYP-B805 TaxID=1578199 RepID=UPI0013ECE703|nr:deoxyribonuclease IV [Brevibacillus sp. SYP-B805]NGQ97462.1 deoxyribonuclease IV [Brevibacillus sp. SYP-B805]
MKVGCHVSIRAGYAAAARTALRLGARSFQYFPKNPRSLAVKTFDRRDARLCQAFCREHGLLSIAHTAYPTNLAVDDPDLAAKTVRSILCDLAIAEACGSVGVVVHFGQYKGEAADPLYGYHLMIHTLNEILNQWDGDALILLENNAGQGGAIGMTLEELTQVRSLLDRPEQVGFCLDTCHAFASGMWRGDNWPEVAEKARKLGYFDQLKAIHLNDSVYPSGSRRDRHANIGRGAIGEEALLTLLQTAELAALPVILETPAPADGSHREEIAFLQERLALAGSGQT